MKKTIAVLIAALLMASMVGCGNTQDTINEEICPGKQPGVAGKAPVRAEGFDQSVDMSFQTVDTNGNSVTNEIFAGSDHGVWIVFWQTNNDKSTTELERLNDMLPIAEENGYRIVGIVMDGEKNADKAKSMTEKIGFTNIVWNDEVATRYKGIDDFFTKEYYAENEEYFENLPVKPNPGDPVSVFANSRGQMQSACVMIPISNENIEQMWKRTNSNATFEELQEQERNALGE